MKKRKQYYGPVTDVPHHPPMASPPELLEAAKPGRMLNEKEIEAFIKKRSPKFKPGFDGTLKLPEGHAQREGRKVLTPPEWRKVGIFPAGASFMLLHLVCHTAFSPRDLRIAGLEGDIQTTGLTWEAALETGRAIELAMSRLR